ncbi:MAG: hypothetical protein HY868_26035 [Chloroflexi bacterium]|nr:hypothetical protein [Chloroflexota bacterium]
MNPYFQSTTKHRRFTGDVCRWLFCAGMFLLVAMLVVIGMEAQILRADNSLVHSTTDDFVRGTFYATGLHNVVGSDGEVQLLPVGFTDNWRSEGIGLPTGRARLAAVSYNNIIYAIGGTDDSFTTFNSDVLSATTNISGTIIAGWSLAGSLPDERAGIAAVISQTATGGVLYVVGGFNNSVPGSGFDTILFKTIDTNGALAGGAWISATMPTGLRYPVAIVRNGYLYIIGGDSSGVFYDTIYRYPITSSSGALGSYTTYTMPNGLSRHNAVIWNSPTGNGYLYILGGFTSSSDVTSIVNYTPFNSDGSLPNPSAWITGTLIDAFSGHGAIQYNGNIHVVGGAQSVAANDYVSKVQSALINFSPGEGSLHDWTGTGLYWIVTQPLLEPRAYHGTTVNVGGYVYVIGGFDKNGNLASTIYRGSTSGTAFAYAPNGTYTNMFDTGAISNTLTSLKWTAWVTGAHTLTMRYRTSNNPTSFPSSWLSATNSITGLNTLVLPNIQNRYLQYQLLYTTTVSSTTPLLRDMQLDYRPPPPPPTPTTVIVTVPVPPPITPARLPDLILSGLEAPADLGNPTPISYTVNISVSNWGSTGFNRAPATLKLSTTARVGQQSGVRGAVRKLPSGVIRASRDYTGTTNYFVWVDIYVDPTITPTIPGDVGSCPAQGGGLNFGWVYALGAGETTNLQIQCYLPQGSHRYFAQVDTCDSPPNGCSPTYGYVAELTEANNIAGPLTSGQKWQGFLGWLNPVLLPSIFKSP